MEARQKEIEYVRKMKVWTKIPRQVAKAHGWKVIQTRWIDINKGDDDKPVYRSRSVGKEFNNGEMDGIFAGPPRGIQMPDPSCCYTGTRRGHRQQGRDGQ